MSNTPTSKVEALREKLRRLGKQNVFTEEAIPEIMQAFATFLEELELPAKVANTSLPESCHCGHRHYNLEDPAKVTRNAIIDQTRTLIQAQVKELRKI